MRQPYDLKSDVWSLGCVLYEMLTLRRAFDGATSISELAFNVLRGNYSSPIDRTKYSASLCDLVTELLEVDPSHRPEVETILRKPFLQDYLHRFATHILMKKNNDLVGIKAWV